METSSMHHSQALLILWQILVLHFSSAQMTTSVEIRPTIAVLMAHATTQCTCAAGYTGDGFFCAGKPTHR